MQDLPAMVSASTMVDSRCATTIVVRAFIRDSSAFCTRYSLALSSALVACTDAQRFGLGSNPLGKHHMAGLTYYTPAVHQGDC